ncbi:MAG: cation diffusion facilitator family transporter, partial [Chloroflexi bacterium]|nr:cation diffusion facilitator family transporter [Chloroflexota bacterium]
MQTVTTHQHDHDHDHHENWLTHLLGGHSHGAPTMDVGLAGSERGIWAVKVSLVVLLLTAGLQFAVVLFSGSVALMADMIHNVSDALTAIPLFIAFKLSERKPTRRYAYGYGRAEDLAGTVVVLMIFASALVVFYESIQKLLNPQPVS